MAEYMQIGNAVKVSFPKDDDYEDIGVIIEKNLNNPEVLHIDFGKGHTRHMHCSMLVDLTLKEQGRGE